ncbi:formylmethanofuran dehydrogenase subunit C [Methanogenium cariaci]|jgi:formylmethanofuran dehydrogenase subunit C
MMKVILEVKERHKPNLPIEAECITPKNFLDPEREFHVWKGNKELDITDVFHVRKDGNAKSAEQVEIIIRGDSSHIKRVGEYMDGGKILIERDIGMHCGNFMSAGLIEIQGDADSWLGREIHGGKILCHGNAMDYAGSGYRGEKQGMQGGLIEIMGDAGDFAGETMAGGEIIIHGNAGDMPGVDIRDGRLTIMGDCSRPCGNMSGGECRVFGTAHDMLPTFRNDGPTTIDSVPVTRFSGDYTSRGLGTIYVANCKYMD